MKSSPPSAWNNRQTEQIISRLISFSEYEMTSHPHLILTVVATSDTDPVNAMHELISAHHIPSNLISTGQYDPSIVQRLYILLHDNTDQINNPIVILKQLQTKFNSSYTKLLPINSFPSETPNLQQPDVWSRYLLPVYYPDALPSFALEQLQKKTVLGRLYIRIIFHN